MADDFYPFVDSGDPAPDNSHITGPRPETEAPSDEESGERAAYATRISIYDDLFSTPRVIVIEAGPVRAYLEEITNTVYRCMKEQGGSISLMVIREIVENFIHAHFVEPIISILDGGNTIRFADQGPGIEDKERAFEFGVTSANRGMKRYIRGTGAGFPMVQQYLEAAGGAISIEDNLGAGTVVTVSVDPSRVEEIKRHSARGAAVRSSSFDTSMRETAGYQQASRGGTGVPGANAPGNMVPGYPQGGYPGAWQQAPAPGYDPYHPGYPAGGMGGYDPHAAPWPYGAYGAPQQAQAPYTPTPYGEQELPPRGFPPYDGEFSTMPRYHGQPAPQTPLGEPGSSPSQQPGNPQGMPQQAPGTGAARIIVSERGQLALRFLRDQGHGGPTELAQAYGQSGPTWSRELTNLNKQGFVVKQGQKYYLTDLGMSWMNAHDNA